MRQGTGSSGYDFGISIADGGNTSSGVSALYHGGTGWAGANSVDRIFNATSAGGAWADGFFAANTGGTWAGGNSAGVGFKGSHSAGGVVALFNQTGIGMNAPVVWASGAQANVGIYQGVIGNNGQAAFKAQNGAGWSGYSLDCGGIPINMASTYIKATEFFGDFTPTPDAGHVFIYMRWAGGAPRLVVKLPSGVEWFADMFRP